MNIGDTKSWTVYSIGTDELEYFVEERDGLDQDFEQRLLEKYKSEVIDFIKDRKTILRLEADIIEAKLSRMKQLDIPMMLDDAPLGYDGTSYELELGGHRAYVKLGWWESGPTGWKPIIEWFNDMVEYLTNVVKTEKNN